MSNQSALSMASAPDRPFQITIKDVYGNTLYYPACDVSRQFADLLGKKTFSGLDLKRIHALGYTIAQKTTPMLF